MPKKKVTKKKKAVSRAGPKRVVSASKIIFKPVKPIGKVTHYYNHIKVGIVKFNKSVKRGVEVRFEGATTDFTQKLASLQYDHKPVAVAPKGKQVGVRVSKRVREGDKIYEV